MTIEQLPAGLLEKLRAHLGSENVIVEDGQLEAVSRTCIPYRELPSVVVYPTGAGQVQVVVQIAREFDIPIWPVSTGKNWGYGEKTACYPGGITMILALMNRIWKVDEELGYAVIEPGVTYKQLNDHLKQHGSDFWADTAGTTQYASVLGNALDKGRGLTPYADHFGCLCGMDVVLPDGQLLETGGGPQGNNQIRHTYKWGVGPYMDGLFAQSNLGIVVKSGIWLMPAPECFDFAAFEYTAPEAQFGLFIDDLRKLVFQGALRARPHLANDFAMMCIFSQYPHDLLGGARSLSDTAAATWRKQYGVARWTFGCGLYGSPEEIKFQKRAIKRTLGRYGLVRFVGASIQDNWKGQIFRQTARLVNRLLGKADAFYEAMIPAINLFRGIPTDHFVRQAYFKSHQEKPSSDIDPARDQCGFVWIGPVVPFTSTHVTRALELAKTIFAHHEFDFFVEVIVESARSVIILAGVFYERNDETEAERARSWYQDMHDAFLQQGYPTYRATTMSMSTALDHNLVAKDVLTSIKQALDPQNLIAPGRYGTLTRDNH
jgi:4-cresol dehydrogenase (hydroxylating)